jgi:thiol-disulfide isomerase/thioredoxin
MKAFLLVAITLLTFSGTTNAQTDSIWITPAAPAPGTQITISFQSANPALAKASTLPGGLYSINKKNAMAAQDLTFHRQGDLWQASAIVPDTSVAIVPSISDQKGKFIVAQPIGLNGSDGQPLRDGYKALELAYSSTGQYLFGVKADKTEVDLYKKKYWAADTTKPKAFIDKINYDLEYKKDTVQLLKDFAALPLDTSAKETDYATAIFYAGRCKNKPLAEILTNLRNQKFPNGSWKQMEYYTKLTAATGADQKVQILTDFTKAYPDAGTGNVGDAMKQITVQALAENGELPEALKLVPEKATGSTKALLYNNIAWQSCLKDTFLTEATVLSKASLDTLAHMETTAEGKPPYFTHDQYVKNIKSNYAMYADTYAYLLYKTGSYKQAFAYEKIAMEGSEDPETDIVSRYHQFMEKVEKPAKVEASLAVYIEKGKSDSAMEAQYKKLYAGKGSADGAFAALQAKANANKQAEMVKTILHDTASKFTLTDLDGNNVSLASLKGKTVVVDFWATWCGPCKASFPAMQKIVDHYKGDTNVAVLFVDTWENVDNKKQNAADFIKQSPYTFHVLLDNDSKVVADYKVDGIPTKFIIDGTGTLRFKAVGFDGSTEGTVNELESMIQIARKD